MTTDKLRRDAELAAELADFVLEEFTEGLNKLEAVAAHEALGNAANVVVSLDSLGGALERDTFNHVWNLLARTRSWVMNQSRRTRIEGTLEEPLDLSVALGLNLARLILENVDELAADELALLFGVVHALQTSEELLTGVNDRQVDSKLLLENLLDLLALVQSHAAVVDENGVESVANGLCHQLRGNGRVDAAADSTEHLAIRANERTNALNLLTNEFRHRPLLLSAADAHSEVLQQLSTLRSVYRLLESAPL